jgi:hypothetical protein
MMKRWYMIVVLFVGLLTADTAHAGWFSWLRPRARQCNGASCQSYSGAVQKSAVQKTDAVQKTEAVQKEEPVKEATQKDAAQKSATVEQSPLYALCLRKARWQAARGRVGHPGWGFGGAHAEGAGFSTASAQSALQNCCYYGQRRIAASAVVRGSRGWYATILYW